LEHLAFLLVPLKYKTQPATHARLSKLDARNAWSRCTRFYFVHMRVGEPITFLPTKRCIKRELFKHHVRVLFCFCN
jgi:hypothetical protein